jgi:hypothetical protein
MLSCAMSSLSTAVGGLPGPITWTPGPSFDVPLMREGQLLGLLARLLLLECSEGRICGRVAVLKDALFS